MKNLNKIKCDVKTCNYNNNFKNICNLDSINISCTCNNNSCSDYKETICNSFETTNSPINDNEYEILADSELIEY